MKNKSRFYHVDVPFTLLGLLCLAWLAVLDQSAKSQGLPALPGFAISHYATVTGPFYYAFAPDGTLFAGRNATGSGGTSADAVPIHRIGFGGVVVAECGPAIDDPDGVFFDATGAFSGTPGYVLVAGAIGVNGTIRAIRPDLTLITIAPLSASFGNPGFMRLDGTGRFAFPSARAQG